MALGLLSGGPLHGYELHRRFRETLGGLWRISESQMYAILKRLEARGLVSGAELEKGTAAARRRLSLTAEGRGLLETWLGEVSPCTPRALRLEFITRLHFVRSLHPDRAANVLEAQRAAVAAEAARAGAAPSGGGIDGLAASFRSRQLEAALEWIEEIDPSAD